MKIDDIVDVLQQNSVPASTINKVVEDLKAIQKELKEDSVPKEKNKFVVVASSPSNSLDNAEAWVLQIKESDDPALVQSQMQTCMTDYNTNTRKGRKTPIRSFAEACRFLPRKFSKKQNLLIKTKESVPVIKAT